MRILPNSLRLKYLSICYLLENFYLRREGISQRFVKSIIYFYFFHFINCLLFAEISNLEFRIGILKVIMCRAKAPLIQVSMHQKAVLELCKLGNLSENLFIYVL